VQSSIFLMTAATKPVLTQEPIATVSFARAAETVYSADTLPATRERYAKIVCAFTERFGAPPAFLCRSPGRVNLIGKYLGCFLLSSLVPARASSFTHYFT
jgi:hypothetical protein